MFNKKNWKNVKKNLKNVKKIEKICMDSKKSMKLFKRKEDWLPDYTLDSYLFYQF